MTSRTPAIGLATVLGLAFTSAAQAQEAAPAAPAAPAASAEVSATAAAPAPAAEEKAPEAPAEPAPAAEPTPAPAPTAATEVKTEQAAAAAAPEEEEKPTLWPLEASTSTWSRGEIRENYDDLGVSRGRFQEGDRVVFRARLGLGTKPLKLTEDIQGQVYIAPQASGSWGTSGVGGTIGAAALGIYEGYFKFTSERFDFKAGRFAMNYGEAMVIGNLDWNEAGRAFDGAHGHYKMNKGYVDLFVTQTAEGAFGVPPVTDPFLGGDSYFWGAYAGLGGYVAPKNFDLDLYFLGLSDAAAEGITDPLTGINYNRDGATRFTLGARVKQKISAVDYRVEGGIQFGEAPGLVPAADGDTANAATVFAYMADAQVGFSFSETMRLAVGGLIASGNDPGTPENEAWNELYPTTHKFLGLMDVIGLRTNSASAYLNFNAGLTKSLSAIVDAHLFATMEANGLGQVADDNFAGGELDLQLLQKIGKWASVRALYGVFLANGDHYATGDAAHYGELQGGIVF